jgi:hypothetical protein
MELGFDNFEAFQPIVFKEIVMFWN